MTASPIPRTSLEADVAAILGLDLSQVVAGSLAIEKDYRTGTGPVARWKGALTLTHEQTAAVEARVQRDNAAHRAQEARRLLAAMPDDERRRIVAELEDGPR